MIRSIYILGICFLIASCSEDTPVKEKDPEVVEDPIDLVTPDFKEKVFANPIHLKLLEELDICETVEDDSLAYYAACSPENFELIPFKDNVPVEDAFILQTRSAIRLKGQELPLPVRHILIFERENGALVRVNGFRGELLATEDSENGAKKLMIAIYLKEDDTLFNCLFKWNGSQYSFESVESLDWGEGMKPLKPEMKDSVSTDIYTSLMSSSLIF